MILYPSLYTDYLEIILLTVGIYYISVWLHKDRCVSLLLYAYVYGIAMCIAYIFQLHVLLMLFPFITPIICVLGIIMHKDALQKNLITHKHYHPHASTPDPQWIEHLLSSALMHINHTKTCTLVIEYEDDMSSFLTSTFTLNSILGKDLLDILLNRHVFDGTQMVWVRSSGTIISSHASWKQHTTSLFTPDMHYDLAHAYTQKTDAIICMINQHQRTCTLIIHGNALPNLTVYNACQLIRKHIHTRTTPTTIQRNYYDVPPIHPV